MSAPTIDEMLESLKSTNMHYGLRCYDAIHAILEQHRDQLDTETRFPLNLFEEAADLEKIKLEAIRAFVERVEKKANATAMPNYWCEAFTKAVGEELAAMEKEAEQ